MTDESDDPGVDEPEEQRESTDRDSRDDDSTDEPIDEESSSHESGDEPNETSDSETTDDDEATDGLESSGATGERREAKTDGEGIVDDLPERDRNEPAYPEPDDDIGGIEAPPDDEEMPLADHIEEMILRLAVVILVGSAATAIGLLWASDAIELIWQNVFPGPSEDISRPHVYQPLELWLTRIKVASLLGIMAALPMFVYQTYLFMRPGLYPHERRYYLAAVPTSVVLAAIGMLFSFFLVLPVLFRYFTYYAGEGAGDAYSVGIAYALGETFNLIITLTGFLAIVFQIPLFIMLAIMMGVTTRRWLAEKRLYFWAAFAGLSFMFTVDPTMMAPVLVAVAMILLFEGTLFLLKWTGHE
ncbi:twin-arginine translocase subunit TatC [Natribaculum luteum]|uniref:Sec-independent protein translocase protein TatC n=1 Tax=Natribaculum luteum TaxID=1586232 RepID=A0ABD5NYU2_9EURY|nr:twin-arginine translocase subunit TatC [Natribaculum luteum]